MYSDLRGWNWCCSKPTPACMLVSALVIPACFKLAVIHTNILDILPSFPTRNIFKQAYPKPLCRGWNNRMIFYFSWIWITGNCLHCRTVSLTFLYKPVFSVPQVLEAMSSRSSYNIISLWRLPMFGICKVIFEVPENITRLSLCRATQTLGSCQCSGSQTF